VCYRGAAIKLIKHDSLFTTLLFNLCFQFENMLITKLCRSSKSELKSSQLGIAGSASLFFIFKYLRGYISRERAADGASADRNGVMGSWRCHFALFTIYSALLTWPLVLFATPAMSSAIKGG
jgi:hypothetical protein